jgi:hypothetical protein
MTKTENLNLPQWEASDAVQREDFNAAFAAIDTGIHTYRLADYTVEAETNEVSFDFTDVDLSQFLELEIRYGGQLRLDGGGVYYLYFNNVREGDIFKNTSATDPGFRIFNYSATTGLPFWFGEHLTLLNTQGGIGLYGAMFYQKQSDSLDSAYNSNYGSTNLLTLDQVNTLTFVFPSTILPGYRFSIIGVRG